MLNLDEKPANYAFQKAKEKAAALQKEKEKAAEKKALDRFKLKARTCKNH